MLVWYFFLLGLEVLLRGEQLLPPGTLLLNFLPKVHCHSILFNFLKSDNRVLEFSAFVHDDTSG